MREAPRWPPEAWIPLAAGLYWLWSAPGHGLVGFVFSVVPGCLLLGSGVAMLVMPGDLRISQFAALGGVTGVVFALPSLLVVGPWHALALVAASAASFLAGGRHTLRLEPHPEEVPEPEVTLGLAAQVGIDEALLSTWTLSLPFAFGPERARIAKEVADARALFEERGWRDAAGSYHEAPPPLAKATLVDRSVRGIDYEHLSFESGYEPRAEEPGRARWLSYTANRTGHAWIVRRRAGGPRPWVVCIHGYQMGSPLIDLYAFEAAKLSEKLDVDVALPVLPLHGPRKAGRRSGDGFLSGDILDTVHAEAQAMWDLRRLLSWIRAQGATGIGVHGMSLGGYNTALLAALDDGLSCAVAGIPATDFTRLMFRHGPPLQVRQVELEGVETADMDEVFRVVSPLVLAPRLPKERLAIYAGTADRIVPAEQVRDLWRHWDRPRIAWYAGAHCTFSMHPEVRPLLHQTLRSGLEGDGRAAVSA
jgi:dienelactone hydrolase